MRSRVRSPRVNRPAPRRRPAHSHDPGSAAFARRGAVRLGIEGDASGAPARGGNRNPARCRGTGGRDGNAAEPRNDRARSRLGRPTVARGIVDGRWRVGPEPGVRPRAVASARRPRVRARARRAERRKGFDSASGAGAAGGLVLLLGVGGGMYRHRQGKPTWRNEARLAASDERPPTIVFGGRADRRRAPSPDATGDGRCLIPSCRSCPALAASHAPGGALSPCATSGVAADVVRAAAQR